MKKLMIAGLFVLSSVASAEITCTAVKHDEILEIRIIDTFVERIASIKRVHPTLSFPLENIGVLMEEKSRSVSFFNEEKDFSLEIERSAAERSLGSARKGFLNYGDLFTITDCVVD